MRIRISRVFIVLLFALAALAMLNPAALVSAQPAAQENAVTMGTVRVDIWPEYDQPSVLVIYNITLGQSVKLPATMSVRIPAAAGKPHAVANEDGANLYNLSYQSSAAGNWIEIKYTTPLPVVRIEYYDPTLKKDGKTRNFTFSWPGDFTVEELSLVVQQPMNATDMSFRPGAGPGKPSSDGLTYYTIQAGKVNAGTTFDLDMTYQKSNDKLTNPAQYQDAEPNQPVDENTPGRVKTGQALPWVIGGAGLLLIAGGTIWFWRTGRTMGMRTEPESRPRHASRRVTSAGTSSRATEVVDNGETVFCNQCGKKAGPGDVFCRSCGTRLR